MPERGRAEHLLTFLLLPAIVVAVSVLSWFSFRASFRLERLRDRSVIEATLSLANEKADRLDQMIIEQDDAVASVVDVSRLRTVTQDWIEVADRLTPTVRAVLVLDLSSEDDEVVAFASRSPGPEDDQLRRLLLYQLLPKMEIEDEPFEQLRHLHEAVEDQSYLVAYFQRMHAGDRYLVVAWHDVARIVHDYFPALYREDEKSAVNVVDSVGRIVFGPPLSGGDFTLGRTFQTTLYKWRLNVALTAAEELASNAARRRLFEMSLAGVSALVVVAGLIVVVLAAARERRLSNLKSEFVANVSHDLKTPLSLVRMFGELLQSGRAEDPAKRKKYVDIIVTESERLTRLIENVLDFARVERGQSAYEFVEADVAEVVGRAVEASRARVEREEMRLELSVAADLPRVELDEGAVEIAVINLIDNATKYAHDGELVRVVVEASPRAVHIAVLDRGTGVPEQDRERIFERFARGSEPRRVRGSGIGLALVRHIAEAHGGRAWVETAPDGVGSRFVMSLGL